MIDNQIIKSYLNCKYKAYLLLNGQLGIKKEYDLFCEELLNKNKSKFYEHAKENIHKYNLEEDVELDSTIKNNRITLVLRPSLSIQNFEIVFDAIEFESNRNHLAKKNLVPILITPNSKVTKFEKNLLSIYSFLLSNITRVRSTHGKIYCGPDLNPVNLNVMLLQTKAKKMFEELQRIAEKSYVPRLYQNSHCKFS